MKAQPRPSLRALNTFGVEASAGLLITLEREEDALALPAFDAQADLLLGGGSNVLFAGDVPGTVIRNRIPGVAVVDDRDGFAWVEAGAGESWHDLVLWTLEQGLSGLENLSLIPGLAGAAPIQNIGAYGVELSSVLDSVTTWDLARQCWTVFPLEQCELSYRDSRFKSGEPDRFLVTSIRLRLNREFTPKLEYAGLREELDRMGIDQPGPKAVSEAVIRLRRRKLPDPSVIGNAGSFFKNPVLQPGAADELAGRFSGLPAWPAGRGAVKCSAAWMIEHCGFKGMREGDAGVSDRHALVLVNHGSASGIELLALARRIQDTVESTFGVLLEPEPRIVEFPH